MTRALLEDAAVVAALLAGLALIAAGVALVYLPAGLVVAGVELVAGTFFYARSNP